MSERPMSRARLVWLAVLFEGGLGALAYLVGWFWGLPPWETMARGWQDPFLGAAVALPMLAGLFLCVRCPVGPLRDLNAFSEKVLGPLFARCTVLDLAVISLCAGFGEEMLFRGVAQAGLADLLGPWPALATAGLLFGLVHPVSVTYVLLATLVGLYLGAVYWAYESLLVVMVAHAVYDFVALVYLTRGGGPEEQAEALSPG